MSTFLEICQDTCDECLIPRASLTSVAGQTGQLADVVRWVRNAWRELQNRYTSGWRWMHHGFTVSTGFELPFTSGSEEPTVGATIEGATSGATAVITRVQLNSGTWAGGDAVGRFLFTTQTGTFGAENIDIQGGTSDVATIAADSTRNGTYSWEDCTDLNTGIDIARFSSWDFENPDAPPKIYLTSAGVGAENWLTWVPWDWFQTIWDMGNNSTQTGYPGFISVDPQNNIRIGPKPNDSYTLSGEFWVGPQVLSADADVPEMPEQFHDLIMYLAMRKYAGSESAQEVMSRAITEGNPLLFNLERNQLTQITGAGPLA
jgi:hypothetical protein